MQQKEKDNNLRKISKQIRQVFHRKRAQKTNKYVKNAKATSLLIREMEIKCDTTLNPSNW